PIGLLLAVEVVGVRLDELPRLFEQRLDLLDARIGAAGGRIGADLDGRRRGAVAGLDDADVAGDVQEAAERGDADEAEEEDEDGAVLSFLNRLRLGGDL